ncbi:gonadotropin-releasing hormone receptor isoform X2 [Diachasmimorpha longicaudata]|uniref:gonadotropin-releasing hormone receptor isoform X2 n=1 Tax=Diachasmimorpha longicaudata TaxID=58733 RepID=UPI0030B872A0
MNYTYADLDTLSSDDWLNLTYDNMTQLTNASIKNLVSLDPVPTLTQYDFIKALILIIFGVVSVIANSFTIWSIARNRRQHHGYSAVYTLIMHLSVADLFVSVFCLMGDGIWIYTVNWPWGEPACKIFKYLQLFSLCLSTFVLVLIGIDRFIAVRYPMKSLNTAKRCNRLVLITWILAAVCSIPQPIVFRVAPGPFDGEFLQCVTHGSYTEPWQEQLYTTMTLVVMFLLPLAILISTYVSTVITIARSQKTFKGVVHNNATNQLTGDVNRERLMHRAKSKSLRISIVIVAAFVIWWTPYYCMMIIFIFLNPDQTLSAELPKGIFFFGMSNSLVNPLIYGAFHLWPKRRRPRRRQSTRVRQPTQVLWLPHEGVVHVSREPTPQDGSRPTCKETLMQLIKQCY